MSESKATNREPQQFDSMPFAIKLKFNFWQRLKVLLGAPVFVCTRRDYYSSNSYVGKLPEAYMPRDMVEYQP